MKFYFKQIPSSSFTRKAIAEASGAVLALLLFMFPSLFLRLALRGGITSDFGCWFWIDVDGLKACQRGIQWSAAK